MSISLKRLLSNKKGGAHQWRGVIEEYRNRLPVSKSTPVVTLCEGGTPLIYACDLSSRLHNDVWLKFEGANPTGSFKDRGMTMAISKAAESGAKAVVCASTGNTSASAAAYAAKAGMLPVVLVPQGKIAMGKLAQAIAHGAKLLQVDGNFDDCLEIARELGFAPDIHALPVGNAGNITAYWRGYEEYRKDSISKKSPQMWGFQASGAAPIVRGEVVKKPETIATAIRIGNPASWKQALEARDRSGGLIDEVTDEEILSAYRLVAAKEGVFVEPSSAAGIAGLIKYRELGKLPKNKKIVITVTGNGLKDVAWVLDEAKDPVVIPVDVRAAADAIGLERRVERGR